MTKARKSSAANSVPSRIEKPADYNVTAVQAFHGLHLEPATDRDVIEFDGNVEPIIKEEEVVTKKKTELTTTRQIETRVKRQVVVDEDGHVVEDSGPIVETNTTEDTDKQESESTERRHLGDDAVDGAAAGALEDLAGALAAAAGTDAVDQPAGYVRTLVSRPDDGLVREVKTNKVVSREETDELLETEAVQHLGDFSDEAYLRAAAAGRNIHTELLSADAQRQLQLVPHGPRVVKQTSKSHKTVDTEDTDLRCLAQPDGTLVTETKKTTEHEVVADAELPDSDDHSTGSREKVEQKESSQHLHKTRDEQTVEFVADGKVIGKEVRYAAETAEMDRDGPMDTPSDWDSLSDRVRKAKRQQKTILQQHRALLADRKDALTERPLDFDREEQTRKGETIKWLENHFGSDRSSSDSHDGDIEPTKKTYFNVTIKSTPSTPVTNAPAKPFPSAAAIPPPLTAYKQSSPSGVTAPAQVIAAERESSQSPPTAKQPHSNSYFHGVTDWSERKEPAKIAVRPTTLHTTTFQEELKGTLERNRLRHGGGSREDLLASRKKDESPYRLNTKTDKRYGSRGDLRYSRESRGGSSDEFRHIKAHKEDLGYLSGSRNDVRPSARRESHDDVYAMSKKQSAYLHREDSGYAKDSREDVRYPRPAREDSFIRDSGEEELRSFNKNAIQRDDSAYVSSSTYFTAPRSPKSQKSPKILTPDSGIRSPSPDMYDSEDVRPTVPQRKRVLEKKLRQSTGSQQSLHRVHHQEPRPDYPRSRSVTPPAHHGNLSSSGSNGAKKYQRTRFASHDGSPSAVTQSTQTLHRTTSGGKPASKVGSAIGNSLRKLVGKIRSASAERKLKIKTSNNNNKRSPSPSQKTSAIAHSSAGNSASTTNHHSAHGGSSTYQQYNVIDGHIGNAPSSAHNNNHHHHHPVAAAAANNNRESSVVSSTASGIRHRDRGTALDRRGSSDIDMASPKQKYYLGEDPYGGSIFGKENRYEGGAGGHHHQPQQRAASQQRTHSRRQAPRFPGDEPTAAHRQPEKLPAKSSSTLLFNGGGGGGMANGNRGLHSSNQQLNSQSSKTLGRFSKSTNRLSSSAAMSPGPSMLAPHHRTHHDYRSTQTLPRKLDHGRKASAHSASAINVSVSHHQREAPASTVSSVPVQNTGPAKPARTYKALNRSKSFNVHGLNGTNDPSPIYIEKLRQQQQQPRHTHFTPAGSASSMYKSNPHLNEEKPQLKSPSIVNLISRSQRDLTKIDEDSDHQHTSRVYNYNHINKSSHMPSHSTTGGGGGGGEKRSTFLRGLQDQAPELYRSIHGEEDTRRRSGSATRYMPHLVERESSLGSRSPVTHLNKDTASIVRRGSTSTDDYSETYKITSKSDDPRRPSVTNSVHTFTKKTVPAQNGRRGKETIESNERKTVTTSRYKSDEPTTSAAPRFHHSRQPGRADGGAPVGPVVIELRNRM